MIKYPAPLAFDSTFAFWRIFLPPELLNFRVEPAVADWLPHSPVRAQLRHTVLQAGISLRRWSGPFHAVWHPLARPVPLSVTVSLALPSSALCPPFLCVPPTVSSARHPPSLLAGSLGSVRHFSCGTMRMLRLPAARPLALRSPVSGGYLLDSQLFRSPRAPGVPPAAPGRWSTGLAPCSGSFSLGGSQSDLSSSQGTLSCFCHALRPRSVLHAKPFAAL
jgi:hypothetical protein